MRITNRMMITDLMRNLNTNMNRLADYQRYLSTGKYINKPSDNPMGVIDSLRFRTRIIEGDKYMNNISSATNWMSTTDIALDKAGELLHRVRELALAGANGTQSQESRRAMAAEIRQLLEQAQTIANSDYGGKYIFAGTNNTEAAFQDRVWLGNDQQVRLEAGRGIDLPVNSLMREFFMGNNQYDIACDRMFAGQYTAHLGTTKDADRLRQDSTDWMLSRGAGLLTGTPTIIDTAPSLLGNRGVTIDFEVTGITCDAGGNVSEVKARAHYKELDNVTGHTLSRTVDEVSFTTTGSGFTANNVQFATSQGNLVINDLVLADPDTLTAGSKWTIETCRNVDPGAGTNLVANSGSRAQITSTYQVDTGAGMGLVTPNNYTSTPPDINISVAPGYENFNGSFFFEVTAVNGNQVEAKVKYHLFDKFSGEHKYFDTNERVVLTAGADNYVELVEKVKKPAFADTEVNITATDAEEKYRQELVYYDFQTHFKFSGMRLEAADRFSVGDRWVIEVTPPVSDPSAESLVTLDRSDATTAVDEAASHKQWVFTNEVVNMSASTALNCFYLDPTSGASKNAMVDIPVNGLQRSSEVINWDNSFTFMNRVQANGQAQDYSYEIQTAAEVFNITPTGPDATPTQNAGVELVQEWHSGPSSLFNGSQGEVNPSLDVNADILLEVVDKVGDNVIFKVTSQQLGRDGRFQLFTEEQTVKVGSGCTFSCRIGDVEIKNINIAGVGVFGIGDKINYHVVAQGPAGSSSMKLVGTHGSDSTQDFTRTFRFNSDIKFPRDINLSFFNVDPVTHAANQASLVLSTRGIGGTTGSPETATFQTGVNFDTREKGLFQILRNLVYDLEREVPTQITDGMEDDQSVGAIYDEISARIGELDKKMEALLNERAQIGAKVNRLDMQKNRMIEAEANFKELLSNAEDADLAEVIMELKAQENVYQAALATGARVIMPSLVDFLR